ncbi:MAG: substrate-binding domain-containing protein, partial [Parafilimonas terrae]|nr:substrate-binding domain-containing protein [Parafilimonas terrae]
MIARQLFLKFMLGAALLTGLAVPAAQAASGDPIGVAMPTKSSQRWIDDGNNIVKLLREKGYKPDLQYADDDIPTQLSQIENMLTKGVKVLVVASIDG